ncbi:MAG: hypothetical protein A2W91_16200 [Bacteroidetes bacterium GWF2_38_335]|nr:MAG: hypothetical protein A2W91_16200 [Bacteroidetes bacterium GWF2_38_335]OFY81232.1 MAG: hypothetical protein A2281_07175 [Bacteroidetes bacterium RIFOXYA12_FULL_38_20]HBS85348.1 hypothetical protein [Bacteroidales bacterium]
MLEFSKQILEKVSFDQNLFTKELNKLIIWLNDEEEIRKLRDWCLKVFGNRYSSVITKTFQKRLES